MKQDHDMRHLTLQPTGAGSQFFYRMNAGTILRTCAGNDPRLVSSVS